ncbi:DUF4173 domain-containing protein [Eubacteriales bacterium OttesenSCG-928-K08]|nr:DUF4173 domain-containing protein [Eubacteriales bacterium OttesenSCG-928-K08]
MSDQTNLYQNEETLNKIMGQPKELPHVSTPQKWLLLGAALIGIAVQNMFMPPQKADAAQWLFWCYAGIWLCYLIVLHVFIIRDGRWKIYEWALAGCAAILCVMMGLQAGGYSDDTLAFLNIIAIPAILMMHAQLIGRQPPTQKESALVPWFFYGFIVQPFVNIGKFFRAAGQLFPKAAGDKNRRRLVVVGIAIAIPLVVAVLVLLLQADAVMRLFAQELFEPLAWPKLFSRIIIALIAAMLFYSFLHEVLWPKPKDSGAQLLAKEAVFEPLAAYIVIIALLVVYVLFTVIQFVYLFGGHGLPEGLTYSEYAVDGFSQLIWVAAINLSVFAFCLSKVKPGKALRILLICLLAATAVILASAFTRLCMYIGAYNLTFRRVQAFWFLCYLSATIVLCCVRLFKQRLPLLRVCALALVGWYVVLNIVDLNVLYTYAF